MLARLPALNGSGLTTMVASASISREHWLMHFHRSVAGVFLALMLVGGLVTVPTNCDCGAGIAHSHSLFILGGHYHGVDGAVFGASHDEMEHHHHHHFESPSTDPHFAGSINHASDRVAADLPGFLMVSTTWERLSYPQDDGQLADGRVVAPDTGPPRAA